MWDPIAHKITINRDAIFDELPLIKSDVDVEVKHAKVPQTQEILLETRLSIGEKENEYVHEEASVEEEDDTENFLEIEEIPQQYLRRSTRVRNFPKRYDEYATFVALISNDGETSCY